MQKRKLISALLAVLMLISMVIPAVSAEELTAYDQLSAAITETEMGIPVGGNYSSASMQKLMDAIETAKAVLENEESTDKELLAQIPLLEEALSGLEALEWDTDHLWEVIQRSDAINGDDYTEESLDKLAEAAHNARLALYYGQSQEEVDQAAADLEAAIDALVELPDAETMHKNLAQAIEDAENAIVPGTNYSDGSLGALLDTIEEAKAMYEDGTATAKEMDKEIYFLNFAVECLYIFDWDTEALWAAIEYAESLNKDDYTEESYAVLKQILDDARLPLYYAQSQEEVDEATSAIYRAIDELVEIGNTEPSGATMPTEATADTAPVITTEPAETTPSSATTEPTETTAASVDEPEITTETTPATSTAPASSSVENTTMTSGAICFFLGDTNVDGKITIKDATIIQKHLAKIITLTGHDVFPADANEDDKVNIKDASEIQKHLAKLPSNENIGKEKTIEFNNPSTDSTTTPATYDETQPLETVPATDATEVTTINTTPATFDEADKNQPSSTAGAADNEEVTTSTAVATDATEATTNTTATTTTSTETTSAVTTEATTENEATTETTTSTENTENTTVPESSEMTLYFTNTQNWDAVNIHYWGNGGNTSWPGIAMEYVETNSDGYGVYKVTVPADLAGVVFNAGDGKAQTVDVLELVDNYGFAPSELKDNKWTVAQYVYSSESNIDFTVISEKRLSDGYNNSANLVNLVLEETDIDKIFHLTGTTPDIDIEELKQNGKAMVASIAFIGSGSNTQTIDKITVSGNSLSLFRTVNASKTGTADMNYQMVLIEVNRADIENVTETNDIYNTVLI